MLKTNEIYHMNCMEGLKLLDDKSVDLVIIDPPYLLNINKLKNPKSCNRYANDLINLKDGFDLKVLDILIQKMKHINIYIYCSKRQVNDLLNYFSDKNCNHEILTWHKSNPSPLTNNCYLPDTEYILFFRERGVKLYGHYYSKRKYYISGTNQVDKKKYKHPTIKPLQLIEYHIENSSKEGDLVLDCFAGSGTTLVGAINLNRRYIGFELDKVYYEIAKKRVEEAETLKKEKNIERTKSEL